MNTKRYFLLTVLSMLLAVGVQAQSFRLDNANLKTQRLMLARDVVNLDYSDFATVAVAANCDYTATSADTWITLRRMANGNTAVFAQPNYNMAERTGSITFTSADGSVVRTVTVVQAGHDTSDHLIPVASGTASQMQSGYGIEKSFDGDMSTYYHSPWYNGTNFPVTLTYKFKEASHVDYAVYNPRQDGNTNGNFKEVKVQYQQSGSSTFVDLGTYNFEGSSAASRVSFGEGGIDNVTAVRFVVKSGAGDDGTRGYAACAEMQFFEADNYMSDILNQYFADALCTKLKPGVTAEQLEQIPISEVRQAAQEMLAGTYSTEFRLGEFTAFRPVGDLQSELKNSYTYNNHENPTGITFAEGQSVLILVEGIGEQPVSLQIRNFGPEVFATSTYPLQNGVNVIKTSNKGNGYINYYTTSWKTAPKVKIHFLGATEQGYFSPKYKGHTNADWKRLLANATGDCLDMHGEFIDCVFPVSSFKQNCPNDGEWLMATYDSVVSIERELMGIYKYKHEFPNRQCAITVATSAGLYHASNDGFCVPVNALRDPTSRTYYDFWGAAHELGHQNQTLGLRWIGLTEVTNNIMSAYVQHKLQANGYHRLENESSGFRYYDFFEHNVMKGGQFIPHANNDVFCTLIPFWQLLVYTRIAGIQPDAYPELYETLRTQSGLASMNDGQQQVNFMRQWCHITKTNFLPFFRQVGMFKTVDATIGDYATRQLTITQSMLDALEKEITAANYAEAPVAFCYLDVNNYASFRDKTALAEGTLGKGCSRSGSNIVIQHSSWPGAVGFETYKADGTLLHMTNYGHGNSGIKPSATSVVWNTAEQPAYIMAVGYDGTRVKCYEP